MNSLWKIPDATDIKTPYLILKEQADYLSQVTANRLHGIINTTNTSDNRIVIDFRILIPALDGYRFHFLTYVQPIVYMYPGILRSHLHDVNYDVDSEAVLIDCLSNIIGSEETKNLLTSLMAQSASARA